MADTEELVWGETRGLSPSDNADATLARLHAVVGHLALAAQARRLAGEFRRKALIYSNETKSERDSYDKMLGVLEQVEAKTWTGAALPKRAALWPCNADGKLRIEGDKPPKNLTWIAAETTRSGGDFKDGEGRVFRLLESDEAGKAGELPFISAYTGTGLPMPETRTLRQRAVPWILGLVGGIGFIIIALNISHTANSFAQAYDLLTGRQAAEVAAFARVLALPPCPSGSNGLCETDAMKLEGKDEAAQAPAIGARAELITDKGEKCVQTLADMAKTLKDKPDTAIAVDAACLDLVGQAVRHASRYLVVTAGTKLGTLYQTISWWAFGWLVPSDGTQPVSLIVPLCLMMAGIIALLMGLGLGTEHKLLGALISPENRYSLALAQVTFWTVLVLTSVIGIAAFNGGLVAEQMRYFTGLDITEKSPDAIRFGFFPGVPGAIWAVLGITFASPALSALMKNLRPKVVEGMPDFEVLGAKADPASGAGNTVIGFKTPLVARDDARKASIADWFLGEDVNTRDRLDITRLQMVMITAGLIVAYSQAIFAAVRDLPTQDILLAIRDTAVIVPSLPAVGATMALMLGASHATYLVAKAAETKPTPEGNADE